MNYNKKIYKIKYVNLSNKYEIMFGGNSNNEVIFITGIPGSGKSTIAKKFEKDGYYLISTDEIVENKLIPLFKKEIDTKFNGKKSVIYGIYHPSHYGNIIEKARKIFVKIIKKIIDKQKKIVIEGTILNEFILKNIFSNNQNFKLYFIKPKNKKIYTDRFIKRFIDDPENYGRLGRLRKLDKNGSALDDYKKNGIKGKIISKLIVQVVDMKYNKMDEWIEFYKKLGFKINYLIN